MFCILLGVYLQAARIKNYWKVYLSIYSAEEFSIYKISPIFDIMLDTHLELWVKTRCSCQWSAEGSAGGPGKVGPPSVLRLKAKVLQPAESAFVDPVEAGEQVLAAVALIQRRVHVHHQRPVAETRVPLWPPQTQVMSVDLDQ